jgi:hypothetical protein
VWCLQSAAAACRMLLRTCEFKSPSVLGSFLVTVRFTVMAHGMHMWVLWHDVLSVNRTGVRLSPPSQLVNADLQTAEEREWVLVTARTLPDLKRKQSRQMYIHTQLSALLTGAKRAYLRSTTCVLATPQPPPANTSDVGGA